MLYYENFKSNTGYKKKKKKPTQLDIRMISNSGTLVVIEKTTGMGKGKINSFRVKYKKNKIT